MRDTRKQNMFVAIWRQFAQPRKRSVQHSSSNPPGTSCAQAVYNALLSAVSIDTDLDTEQNAQRKDKPKSAERYRELRQVLSNNLAN